MTGSSRWLILGLLCAVATPASGAGSPVEGRDDDFPAAEPATLGIDPAALERLRKRAEATDSDAVVIVKDGKLAASWTFGKAEGPIETRSATKSIVSLAIGRLIDDGKIASIDRPVLASYPEWDQGRKRKITVRSLLNHTSGLQNTPVANEIETSPDSLQYALAAELSDDPGSRFSYNNKAVNLLSGIVEKASGERMDRYVGESIFRPLGIKDFSWLLDNAGHPFGMAGLRIRALDFAKVGQMMLDGGTWRGKRVVSEAWVKLSTAPAQDFEPTCGLLWWRVAEVGVGMDDAFLRDLKEFGPSDATIRALEALKGRSMEWSRFWPTVSEILHRDDALRARHMDIDRAARGGQKLLPGKVLKRDDGFKAHGFLGQFLVVLPESRLVAVRQCRGPADLGRDGPIDEGPNGPIARVSFDDFPTFVRDLAPARPRE